MWIKQIKAIKNHCHAADRVLIRPSLFCSAAASAAHAHSDQIVCVERWNNNRAPRRDQSSLPLIQNYTCGYHQYIITILIIISYTDAGCGGERCARYIAARNAKVGRFVINNCSLRLLLPALLGPTRHIRRCSSAYRWQNLVNTFMKKLHIFVPPITVGHIILFKRGLYKKRYRQILNITF